MASEERAQRIAVEVIEAYFKARREYAPMRRPHEGYAVLLEEVDELWDEVKRWQLDSAYYPSGVAMEGGIDAPTRQENRRAMRKEALHVAAMALAFLLEVCDEN